MHLLITGSSGFVGTNIIPYLHHHLPDVKISCIVRKKQAATDISWNELTLSHFHDVDAIIHLAGKAHDTKNTSETEQYFEVNYELTKKLYDLFLQSKSKKFIYMSSVKAAADRVNDVLYESAPATPETAYGQSKLKAEEYIIHHLQQDIQRSYILRPCMIHGPGNKGNLNLLYQFAKLGIPYPLAAFENQRSFLSIENLCFLIEELLEKNIDSGIYQAADDESLSTTDLIKIMAIVNQKKPQLWRVSKELVINTAKLGDKFRLPLNSERLQKLTENYVVSNEKIKQALHIHHLPVNATEGLLKTIKSFSQQKT